MAIALYARKSVERENSISCETQLEYCRSMIKPDERNEKILEFVDNGFSGGNTDRDGFQKMMRQIERGKITKLIVYRLDRVSRSLSDFVKRMKKQPICFDRKEMRASFMGVEMDFKSRYVCGEKQQFPYKLFDSPFMRSEYGSGIYHVISGTDRVIYDFNEAYIRMKGESL